MVSKRNDIALLLSKTGPCGWEPRVSRFSVVFWVVVDEMGKLAGSFFTRCTGERAAYVVFRLPTSAFLFGKRWSEYCCQGRDEAAVWPPDAWQIELCETAVALSQRPPRFMNFFKDVLA